MLTHYQEALASVFRLTDCQTDDELIGLWLHGKSPHTREAYKRDIAYFLAFIESKPLIQVKMEDVAAFSEAMVCQGYTISSIRRRLYAVKSLLSFGQKVGYLLVNVGKPVDLPKDRETLAERILSESEVLKLIALEPKERNRLMLRFLYETGCRVSEMCQLKWKHLKPREGSGQVTIFGKGSQTRNVLLTQALWDELQSFRRKASANAPVFHSKSGRHLSPRNVWDIVKAAAKRAGIEGNVSAHWLRHSHASHALERGAPIHLVQATLGHASVATTGMYLHARPQDSSARYLPR
ncbi:tyrosine-type recombinase/integrase [Microcoleus sp. FACHB-SPT15]|uniref:tyrosine-type recombinase/integrase n=1 Tax=Microcoleus sp. FACHB-SPT15 TaxID=2692830 RepID=UPI001783C41D|nr:tyrosine-type recombinase/integrase [Microcoleus sp. FACHB-SPT15]MBD1806301.1 tyrosine-type recombinase/integrase [Microcoleus sp. FACHB-SPT15]